VHGWVYSLSNGLVTDLKVGISSLEDYQKAVGGPC
jgi:carbonic anhydrase